MRLDKYLKVSRLIKRRTLAKEICSAGKIQVNGRIAKAGTEVKAGDELIISIGGRSSRVRIIDTPPSASVDVAKTLYEEVKE